ncbi:BMP family ABC transporter substrate-binding protein [Kocuria sp. M1R5S2]|uniref:BMP family ABC transporter substrate-binding protein n=1 Tax=Kocuria rhizosphaerae TaxID=3376285 RepID=UPI00379C0D16
MTGVLRAGRTRAALLTACAVVLAGGACARTGADDVEPVFTGCAVSDTAGFTDGSPGGAVWDGLQAAAAGTGIELERVESSTEADFVPGLAAMVQAGCDLTVAAGPGLTAATRRAASAHPEARFAVVGGAPLDLPNVTSLAHGSREAVAADRIAASVHELVRAAARAGAGPAGAEETRGSVADAPSRPTGAGGDP